LFILTEIIPFQSGEILHETDTRLQMTGKALLWLRINIILKEKNRYAKPAKTGKGS
jgi:hypothetical protein